MNSFFKNGVQEHPFSLLMPVELEGTYNLICHKMVEGFLQLTLSFALA